MSMVERYQQVILTISVAYLYLAGCMAQVQARVMTTENPPTLGLESIWIAASDSMSPTLRLGDGVIVDKTPFGNLTIGDIIVSRINYTNPDTNKIETVIHRVAQIVTDPDNGQRIIRAKGDANPDSIPQLDYPIFQHNYIGKVVLIIPQLGMHLK